MTPQPKNTLSAHLRASDLRAVAQLATQATVGVAMLSEGVHQAVWRTLGMPDGETPSHTRGLTGLTYKSVRGVTQLVGKAIELALAQLQTAFDIADRAAPETFERQAVLAALNGVMGDRLAADKNPLTTPMSLRYPTSLPCPHHQTLDWQAPPADLAPTGKVLLLVHGLCMNDLQWTTVRLSAIAGDAPRVHSHGVELRRALGYTPVYLRYNTGLHTSQNGQALSDQLAQLVAHWPAPLEEITVVAHSMGGLVTRSAVHLAQQQNLPWVKHLKNIVFLGTPHHGAPLERAGNWVDAILGSTPYSKPFAKLGQLRSRGITDLRYGEVLGPVQDADGQGQDRFRKKPDSRQPVPLPQPVNCFTVAATTAARRSLLADRLIGDGLVPLPSALGQHDNPRRRLKFAKTRQFIAYKTNHMQLLSSPAVAQQLVAWLSPDQARQP
jgi:pimeloyl-ACP methyl ester carboxylesterase